MLCCCFVEEVLCRGLIRQDRELVVYKAGNLLEIGVCGVECGVWGVGCVGGRGQH